MKIEELKIVIEAAKKQNKMIMDKYSRLSGYPVFSSQYGQCELKSELVYILMNFPHMIQDSDDKACASLLTNTISKLEAEKKKANTRGDSADTLLKKIQDTMNELNQFADKLELKEETFVELRFEKPILEAIFKLQKDPLVSQIHTPQTKASVRIVLGTLGELYHSQRSECQ
jgi:uncharacterized UPF0160 family protein